MNLPADLLTQLTTLPPDEAWEALVQAVWATMSAPLSPKGAVAEVNQRDRAVGRLDHFLASCGWELWHDLGDVARSGVPRTSTRLVEWFKSTPGGKAVLILDGLSLRELPWLLEGAPKHGLTIVEARATAAELPGETTPFAQALGLSTRSQLQNNGGGTSHKLQAVRTESVDLPFLECAGLVDLSPNQLFWHHWPDSKLHLAAGAGQGLDALTRDAAEQLTSDDFWAFVKRLAQGRRLVITSDHGYAATGLFADAPDEPGRFLKTRFASGRGTALSTGAGDDDSGPFVPPVTLRVDPARGPHLLALGRFKWKSQGGYPTLTHGGLSLLEMLSPFIELTL